ncbi:MAG: hypothetical protein JWO38_5259 [Gemmataceae bacterium]|nr:hypothetical protein [Gemmataceae bacterium]
MAHETTQPVHVEDVAGVRSRVSWGALLGGTVIALACSLVLTFFFAAVGLSLTEADLRGDALGIGAIAAAVVTIVVSLFLGGWVTTQLTAGETRQEAVLYGVLTWATVTAASLAMVGMNIKAGYFALVGGTLVAQNGPVAQQRSWEDMARAAGVTQDRIDAAKQGLNPDRARAAANDPEARRRAEHAAVAVAWGGLVAMLLSIGAAVGGAVVGCGPSFRVFPVVPARGGEILIAR